MTTHDELVEEVSSVIRDLWQQTKPMAGSRDTARAIIALIAERLREPSEEMIKAVTAVHDLWLESISPEDDRQDALRVMRAAIAASALYPPKEGTE